MSMTVIEFDDRMKTGTISYGPPAIVDWMTSSGPKPLLSSLLDSLPLQFPIITQRWETTSLTRAQQRTYVSALRYAVKIIP